MIFKKLAIVFIFIWIGFVSAISFMEAWLKFRAALVTLPIGLSIGRLIFSALNKVEWGFVLVTAGSLVFSKDPLTFFQKTLFVFVVLILLLQTFWLLPALKVRAEIVLSGGVLTRSFVHFYYLFLEIVKVVSLFLLGFSILKK